MGVWFHSTLVISDFPITPDFVGILLILPENPESHPICHQDKKKPDFDLSRYFQVNSYDT